MTSLGRRFLITKVVEGKQFYIGKMKSISRYESAIEALNGLQSNASVVRLVKERRGIMPEKNLVDTERFLERAGIEASDLDHLNVIHVAGTKGKGSVCAMTEAILRHHGLKTGFYSSPHLVHVRERIRINGVPLSQEKFAEYFWALYERMEQTKPTETIEEHMIMPAYFKFLTLLSFHVFLAEKVDVAIMEVGIGGSYDCTNVVKHPVVCGITTLDLDHTGILGDTLEKIAWHKGGIMKAGAVAVTMTQPESCLEVLSKQAAAAKCPLYRCPPLSTYDSLDKDVSHFQLGIPGRQQMENASLSLQLANLWLLRRNDPSYLPEIDSHMENVDSLSVIKPFSLSLPYADGLKNCRWPGRSQTLVRGQKTFFLDGAHTPKSMELCSEWFKGASVGSSLSQENIIRILVFNCTSDRNPESLLKSLEDIDFDFAIFCPNMIYTEFDIKSATHEKQMDRCELIRKVWLNLQSTRRSEDENETKVKAPVNGNVSNANAGAVRVLVTQFADKIDWRGHYPNASLDFDNFDSWTRGNGVCPSTNRLTAVFPCVSSTLAWIDVLEKSLAANAGRNLHVLVTGSLHLVGSVLSIVDPELKS